MNGNFAEEEMREAVWSDVTGSGCAGQALGVWIISGLHTYMGNNDFLDKVTGCTQLTE